MDPPRIQRQTDTDDINQEMDAVDDSTVIQSNEAGEYNSDDDSSTGGSHVTPMQVEKGPKTMEEVVAGLEKQIQSTKTTQENMVPPRAHKERVSFKLNLRPSLTLEKSAIDGCKGFLDELKKHDKTAVVYPFKDEHNTDKNRIAAITSARKIHSYDELKMYFSFQRYPSNAGIYYVTVYVGTKFEFFSKQVKHKMDGWLKENDFDILPRQLQCERTSMVGWLLYSHKTMDARTLEQSISHTIGYTVECRWQVIQNGTRGRIPNGQRIQAMHVLCNSTEEAEVLEAVRNLYDSKATDFPLGIRMRYVPLFGSYSSPDKNHSCLMLRERQGDWQQGMCSKRLWVVKPGHLDEKLFDALTLRQQLMEVRHPSRTDQPLFHSVDEYNNEVWAVYHPDAESEAFQFAAGVIVLLRQRWRDRLQLTYEKRGIEEYQFLSPRLYCCFTASGIKNALTSEWCDKEKGVVSCMHKELKEVANSDADYVFPKKTVEIDSGTMGQVAKMMHPPAPGEDSIGTIRTDDMDGHAPVGDNGGGSVSSAVSSKSSRSVHSSNSLQTSVMTALMPEIQAVIKTQCQAIRDDLSEQFQQVLTTALSKALPTHPSEATEGGPPP